MEGKEKYINHFMKTHDVDPAGAQELFDELVEAFSTAVDDKLEYDEVVDILAEYQLEPDSMMEVANFI